ncbi:MAG: T9SS type A sorting domain-containing protein [Bacteroidia bacterium]|nr:T9SS type A sorting domain-containing protein [Bacteroidia bacterium]
MKINYFLISFILLSNLLFAQYSEPDAYKTMIKPDFRTVLKSASYLLNQYDQKFIHIDISANESNVDISGNVKYTLLSKVNSLDTIYFELTQKFTVDSIQVNSQQATFYFSNDTLLAFPSIPISQNSLLTVQIWYHRIPGASVNWNSGLKNTHDGVYNQDITWTLSESFHLNDWVPCKQDLTDRLDSAWIFVTVDSSLKAGSNGILSQITHLTNGKLRYEWKEHHPIVYYLLSIAVGKYNEYNIYAHPANSPDSILIQNYIYNSPQFLIDNSWQFSKMVPIFELYCDKFGPYPWADEKFGHALCPVGGGMEHQTMTTLGHLSPDLVAHELTHQWFGDKITCASWQDIWVNEGFASYGEYIFHQNLESQANADGFMYYCHTLAKQKPFQSVYIPFSEAWDENRIFSPYLSYKKGAAIIHMLRYLSNTDSLFFVALKQMQAQYADSVLTGADVKNIFAAVNGKSFDDFFNQYYYGEGYPIYKIVWQQDSIINGYGDLKVKLEQHGSFASNNLFTIPVELKIYTNSDSVTTVINPTQNVQTFNINVNNKRVNSIIFDPNNWVLDSLLSITQEVPTTVMDDFFISIYPNPVSENIYFKYSGTDGFKGNLRLLDLSGREVLYHQINSKLEVIPLKNIKPGMYLSEITGNHITFVRKMVIIK